MRFLFSTSNIVKSYTKSVKTAIMHAKKHKSNRITNKDVINTSDSNKTLRLIPNSTNVPRSGPIR